MYDLSGKFNTFYKNHVVLPQTIQNDLNKKKILNVDRLKEGLKEYNDDNGTRYSLIENFTQGSVAMHTVIQNESNDFDIDVAIVFEKDEFELGSRAAKNVVENALKRKCTNFKTPPTAKTNCVTIEYKDRYHIDFAIYRRYRDEEDNIKYDHAGNEWRFRDPRAITSWFINQNKTHNGRLREIVRLLKVFSKSRDWWVNMPGGLVLSVLADECFQDNDRIDERFYYTIGEIIERLENDTEILNPTDSDTSLKLVGKDDIKVNNLLSRLRTEKNKLDILFDDDCTESEEIEAWSGFFNQSYWTEQLNESREFAKAYLPAISETVSYRETEEFIEHRYPVSINPCIDLKVLCNVYYNDRFEGELTQMYEMHQPLLPGRTLKFFVRTTYLSKFQYLWKAKNNGPYAEEKNDIRGEIGYLNQYEHEEHSSYPGNHYVECYAIQRGEVVARAKIDVIIKLR